MFSVETKEDVYYISDGGHNELSCIEIGDILMNHQDDDPKSMETWGNAAAYSVFYRTPLLRKSCIDSGNF